jgi:hypothetical protein
MRVVGENDVGPDEYTLPDSYHLQKAIAVYPAIVSNPVAEFKH